MESTYSKKKIRYIDNLQSYRENDAINEKMINLKNLCRFCCSNENSKVMSMSELKSFVSLDETMTFLQLDFDSRLSEQVCEECFNKLLYMDRFKRKCQAAQKEMLEEINRTIEQLHDNKLDEMPPIIKNELENTHVNKRNLTFRQSNRSHQCFFCREIFHGSTTFRLHKKICSIKGAKCTVEGCNKLFVSQSGFNTHRNYIHGIPKVSKYSCVVCSTTYQMTSSQFQEHYTICLDENEYKQQSIQCDICKTMCNNLETYASHKMYHDTKNLVQTTDDNGINSFRKQEKNSFVCDLCGKVFGNSRNIRKHKQNVHLVDFDGEMLSCDLCHVKKPTKRLLYKHMKSVHIIKLTPCEICGKVYKTRELWQKHSLTHNELKKTHVCTYCPHNPRFICKSALQKHLKGSHGECTIGNKFRCDLEECEASYASEISLNKHKLRVHGYL